MVKVINIIEIIRLRDEEGGLGLIRKLMEWGVLASEGALKCPKNHTLQLVKCSQSLDGFKWRCQQLYKDSHKKTKRCNYIVSLRNKTFFEKSHLPLWKICCFINLWAMNVALNVIEVQIEITKKSAVDWASFCREVLECRFIGNKTPLGGPGKTVEIDESKFGRRKYHRGHRVEGQWVFGGVERETGNCFLVPVETRDANTLITLIKDWILPGTTIVSDCWKAYHSLNEEGFQHLTVNHSVNFVDPDTGAHTNAIESTWRHVKQSMPNYHRKKAHFSGYLAKYMYLKGCRMAKTDPTVVFFNHAAAVYNPQSHHKVEDDSEELESDGDDGSMDENPFQ